MTEVRVFPPGVRTGVPFESVLQAAAWLTAANAGEYGQPPGSFDPTSGTEHSPHPRGAAPQTPRAWPTSIPTSTAWPTVVAYVLEERMLLPDDSNPLVGAGFLHDGTGYLPAAAAYWTGYDPWAISNGGSLLLGPVGVKYASYRLALSWHNALRRLFDAAKNGKERTPLARPLRLLEETAMTTGAAFTAAAGVWVTTVWADCSTQGQPVEPTDPDDRREKPKHRSTFRIA